MIATSDRYVSLKSLASEIGMDRSHMRRYVLRLGITPHKRRTPDSRHQLTLAVDDQQAETIRQRRDECGFSSDRKVSASDVGEFYVIQLVPELDSRRVKLGFAENVSARLEQHRTAAPTAKLLSSWPCRRSWEGTLIECLSLRNCRLIRSEVFECDDVKELIEFANQLFVMFPDPARKIKMSNAAPS
jgi:hypothetical protein